MVQSSNSSNQNSIEQATAQNIIVWPLFFSEYEKLREIEGCQNKPDLPGYQTEMTNLVGILDGFGVDQENRMIRVNPDY